MEEGLLSSGTERICATKIRISPSEPRIATPWQRMVGINQGTNLQGQVLLVRDQGSSVPDCGTSSKDLEDPRRKKSGARRRRSRWRW